MSASTETPRQQWQIPAFETHELATQATRYCVAIPVINEGERIRGQLDRMRDEGIAEAADILILDGGSTDGSLDPEWLRSRGVRTLLIKRGPGKLSAQLRMGYSYALDEGYEGIVTVDGNGKDGTDAIPRFLSELDAGWDMVQGSRYVPPGEAIRTPLIRSLAINLLHAPLISLAAGFRYTDTTNGYRGYSRRLLVDPRVQPFRDVFSNYELLAYLSVRAPQTGHRVKEIGVRREYPADGAAPTKISHVRGNFDLLKTLFEAVAGAWNPRREA